MECCSDKCYTEETIKKIKLVLYIVFFINFGMFFVELVSGIVAKSNALKADSLDMFGDAFVYGLSLFVLNKKHSTQAKASLVKGISMLLLGFYVLGEAVYKIIYPTIPLAETITIVGVFALIANAICFYLLTRQKDKSINIRSAWICSRNDIYANVGVIGAGFLVGYFNSMWPDIITGLVIAGLILYFSVGVVKESLKHI